ncbi:MAG: quinone oxidoreductase family protein [Gaiellaceae bacterium]
MKAVVLERVGGPEQLELQEVPEPEAEDGALVRVRASGINFADLLIRQGRYPQPPPLPTVPGMEVAGELDGRRVMGLTSGGGGYAELAPVDERWLAPLPESASFAEGASFLLTFLTAWIPLTRQVRVREGSTVLVHAAAGGVGTAAVQLARHLGARVVATAGSEEKPALARELGAELTLDYREHGDFGERLRRETGGVDVVVDPVGGPVFAESLKTLAPLGVVIGIGYAGGLWEPLDPGLLVGRNLGVQGFYLGRLMAHRPELVREAIGELVALWEEGAVRPIVGAEYPLGEAADAHRLIEERRSTGKVVLVP